MDPIHPQHHWCLCGIGTDEHGNCVGEQCLIYSTTPLFIVVNGFVVVVVVVVVCLFVFFLRKYGA